MSQTTTRFTTGNGSTTELTETERHALLESERRRIVLDVLAEATAPMDLETVASSVAAREGAPGTTDDEAVQRVALGLHHTDLPKLDAVGVIDYDWETNRVRP